MASNTNEDTRVGGTAKNLVIRTPQARVARGLSPNLEHTRRPIVKLNRWFSGFQEQNVACRRGMAPLTQ